MWHLVQLDKMEEHHFIKLSRVETFAQIIWGVARWEAAKRAEKIRINTVSPIWGARDLQRLENNEVTLESLQQERGLLKFRNALDRLKSSAASPDLAKVLEGHEYEQQSKTQPSSYQRFGTHSKKVSWAAIVNLARAYRLFGIAEGYALSEQTFIPIFCKVAFHDGEWERALDEVDTSRDWLRRFADDEIEESDESGGIGHLYKREALELVRSAKEILMVKHANYANIFD
jgi:hypothetical protein